MESHAYEKLIKIIDDKCVPFSIKDWSTHDSLMGKIGDARFVLMGEATHGTFEFYQARAEISKQLILQKGFMAIAIEGDWPDAYQINRYLKGKGSEKEPEKPLKAFKRFPKWMWRNNAIVEFIQWLREYNDNIKQANEKIGFYGLDLYSLDSSMQAVITYLKMVDPKAAKRAQERYSCFDHLTFDPEIYGYLTSKGIKEPCVSRAVEQLLDLQHNSMKYMQQDGLKERDEYFYAAQNARIVKNAEKYYRSHFEGPASSWNIRDSHMAETLNILSDHLEKYYNRPAKIIVWAHNSHVGDARATEMGENGEINIGQLVREQHDTQTYTLGFSTYQGFVTAALKWGAQGMKMGINPGVRGSYEELFHHIKHKNFMLDLSGDQQLEHYLSIPRLQRAIGVVYRANTERESHYFFSKLPYQFDSIIHLD